jgi:Uma2 family endonuclease
MSTNARAMIDDLARLEDHAKAEIVHGELVPMAPTGGAPNRAAGAIYISLRQHERLTPGGRAYGDNAGFIVDLPDRDSFSPDAAFHIGESPDLDFLQGAPIFAVEVRSKGDYGPAAERAMAEKRADYFAAGTRVVWDVDLLGEAVVAVYRHDAPTRPTIYRRGEVAEAEPAVPGWRLPVDLLFE